jgi:hypothetical protein
VRAQFATETTNYGDNIVCPIGGANSAIAIVATFEDTTWSGLMARRKNDTPRLELAVSGSPESDYNPEMVDLLLRLKEKGPVASFKGAAQVLERFNLSKK